MNLRAKCKAIWGGWLKALYFLFTRISGVLVLMFGLYWTFVVFLRVDEDTTVISNTAFAISATLAALCFSCARSITDSDEASDRFAYAGERFMHSAVMLLSASILKYAYLSAELSGLADPSGLAWTVLTRIMGIIAGVLFLWAISSAHGGFLVINKLLWGRFNRYPDWDDIL